MRVELHLLGRFAASLQGTEPAVLAIAAPRLRAILAYLAMQPAYTETRERLAALLWGDSSDKQARQSLRQCLVALRRELGAHAEALTIEREVVGLVPERIAVDARELLESAARPSEAAARRALELYRGEFLDGLELDVEPFTEWLRAERARIADAAARLLETGAITADRAGHGAEAVAMAERLVALDPVNEHAQRLLLRLVARHRGREAALARADQLIALLQSQLDAAPEKETTALIAEIRALPPGPVALPAPEAPAAPLSPIAAPPPSAPPAPRRGWSFGRSAAAVALIGGLALAAIAYDRGATVGTAPDSAGPDPAWRSPLVPGAGPDQRALATQGAHAIVVLPLDGEGDANAQRLGDRIAGDLTNSLSRVPGMRVIARATARLFRQRPIDVAAIGSELGVRYVVDGSVRIEGATLRIDVALIDAKTRLQVWTQRVERAKAESFAVEDEIARGIARHLHLEILGDADRRAAPGAAPSAKPAAGDTAALLARGWGAMLQIAAAGTSSGADRYFEEVLRRDPENVSAMIGLAGYHATVVAMFLVSDPEPHLERAEPLIARALAKAPNASMAHYFQGVLHKTRARPKEALASFARTVEINPSFSLAYAQIGHVLSRIGRLSEALEHIRYAIRLSPRDPNLALWNLFGGQIELERGNDAAALEWLRRATALDPKNPFNHASLAAALALKGDKAGAAEHAAKTKALAPWLTRAKMEERLVGLSTDDGKPRRLLEGLKKAFE